MRAFSLLFCPGRHRKITSKASSYPAHTKRGFCFLFFLRCAMIKTVDYSCDGPPSSMTREKVSKNWLLLSSIVRRCWGCMRPIAASSRLASSPKTPSAYSSPFAVSIRCLLRLSISITCRTSHPFSSKPLRMVCTVCLGSRSCSQIYFCVHLPSPLAMQ